MTSGSGRLQSLFVGASAAVSSSCMLLTLFKVDEDSCHTYVGAGTSIVTLIAGSQL